MPKQIIVALLAALALTVAQFAPAAADPVIAVPSEDAEMNAAIVKARASLPEFFKTFDNPGPGENGFSLKVRIPYGTGTSAEHFWLTDIERKGDKFAGTINGEPENAKQVQSGQRYEFGEQEISDWLFMRNGKMVGNETMRPLLERMPADEAERYRALYETP
jgi:uncharacterized protein YegJ (DUF2314 family)